MNGNNIIRRLLFFFSFTSCERQQNFCQCNVPVVEYEAQDSIFSLLDIIHFCHPSPLLGMKMRVRGWGRLKDLFCTCWASNNVVNNAAGSTHPILHYLMLHF